MMFLLYTIHVLICFFLIAVVLLQQGKGADLSVFGGGATQTAFGARGAASVLHKLTVGSFVAFILTTLAIGVVQSNRGSSLIQDLPDEAVEEEVVTEPEGALPTEETAEETTEADGEAAEATASEGDAAAAEGDAPAAEGDASAAGGDAADGGAADGNAAEGGQASSEESGN